MLKACPKGFSLVWKIVLTATLLLFPFIAAAGGLEHHANETIGHASAIHQANAATESASGHKNVPLENPLHCHEKTPTPQATGLGFEWTPPDQTLLVIEHVYLASKTVTSPLTRSSDRIPIDGPSRFILLSNFRS